ncbi:MAG TPA: hypothetical protein ENG97_01780 [Deltaproteobacteria bacterium]|nr:hypothetical protein [Deltaproteobacteria bacterium]
MPIEKKLSVSDIHWKDTKYRISSTGLISSEIRVYANAVNFILQEFFEWAINSEKATNYFAVTTGLIVAHYAKSRVKWR